MTKYQLIKRIDAIRDEAYWQFGCSHEDVLKESLLDIEKQLAELIKELIQEDK